LVVSVLHWSRVCSWIKQAAGAVGALQKGLTMLRRRETAKSSAWARMANGICAAFVGLGLAGPALAGPFETTLLGAGQLFSNDALGDNLDRWQTGGVAASWVYGRKAASWAEAQAPGQVIELRFGGRVVAPANLVAPGVDRLYAGALSLGAHTHYQTKGWDVAMGLDLMMTGPQTGLDDFHSNLHRIPGIPGVAPGVSAAQVDNGLHPTFVMELGRDIALGPVQLRPFVEARAGAETLVRLGGDLTFGRVGSGELLVRDEVTGQRYRAVTDPMPGFAFVLGGDIAAVKSSVFFPARSPVTMEDSRSRVRAGLHWQGQKHAAFYGVTWASEEFTTQSEGQVIGSFQIDFNF